MTEIININNYDALKAIDESHYTKFSLSRNTGDAMNGYGKITLWVFEVGIICDVCRKCGVNPELGIGPIIEAIECNRHSWRRGEVVCIANGVSDEPKDAIEKANKKAKKYISRMANHRTGDLSDREAGRYAGCYSV
jgi:hypothetical protein